ncbi:MAG: META domain-containing protein [Bacteroidetes bacterium]|uniref:META domain-containing protein n=1 Tax=Candidatus Cryptobacteroides faecavium TaxID=2840762 RepID=A0A9D9IF17_9BACT|nr:META domain-containing protein [Candidatus Cryptobacteroides faecavium]
MKNILTAVTAAILLGSCATGVNLSGKWEIVSLNGETVNAIETKPFLEFDTEKSEVHGNTGCNLMNGSYSQDGKKLSFGNMATTMMAGPDMDLEREVLDAINKTASIKDMAGNKVQVFDANGNLIMELQKK